MYINAAVLPVQFVFLQLRKGGSGDQSRQTTPLPTVKKKEVQQESPNLFRTPVSCLRRTPEQVHFESNECTTTLVPHHNEIFLIPVEEGKPLCWCDKPRQTLPATVPCVAHVAEQGTLAQHVISLLLH